MINRWRLILGEFAEDMLPLEERSGSIDDVLNFLYNREYDKEHGYYTPSGSPGGRSASVLTVPLWISKVKKLFPKKTVEIMQKQALDRYNLKELLIDKDVLKEMEPNLDLLKNILAFKDMMPENVKSVAYEIVKKVADDISKRLEVNIRRTFYGKKLPNSTTSYKIFRNLDMKKTIRKNLKNYDNLQKQITVDKLYFNQNIKKYNPWDIIILIDESGSMMDSVIYSSVMGGIFAKLPFISIKLVIFDTSIVDLSDKVDDIVGTLMNVQLGGGTDIYQAMEYAKKIVTAPQKTIVVLISDLEDGNAFYKMYSSGRDIIESGAKLFVLPALDYSSTPIYNKEAAKTFANMGANVAAITPEELANWISKTIS